MNVKKSSRVTKENKKKDTLQSIKENNPSLNRERRRRQKALLSTNVSQLLHSGESNG